MSQRYKGTQQDLLVPIAIIALLMGLLMPALARIRQGQSLNKEPVFFIIIGIIFIIGAFYAVIALLHKRRINKITGEQFSNYLRACEEIFSKSILNYPNPPVKKVIEISGLDARTEILIRQNEYFLVQKFPGVIAERISDITREQLEKYLSAEKKLTTSHFKEHSKAGVFKPVSKKEIAEESGLDLNVVSRIMMYNSSYYGNPF